MKTFAFVLVMAFASMIVAGCNQAGTDTVSRTPMTSNTPASIATPNLDEFAATRAVFKEHCAKCHGETGAGGRVDVDGKELRVPNLTGEHARKPSDEKLADKITNGDDEMPAFKEKLTPEQINDLVRFIRKEFQQ